MDNILIKLAYSAIGVVICIIRIFAAIMRLIGSIFDLISWAFHAMCEGLLDLGDQLSNWRPFNNGGKYIEKTE